MVIASGHAIEGPTCGPPLPFEKTMNKPLSLNENAYLQVHFL